MLEGEHGPRERLQAMTDGEFIAAWTDIFGGPPAAMLDRGAMIGLMLDEGPATFVPRLARHAASLNEGTLRCNPDQMQLHDAA